MAHEALLLAVTATQIVFASVLYFVIIDDHHRLQKFLKPSMLFFILLDLFAMYLIIGHLPDGYFC